MPDWDVESFPKPLKQEALQAKNLNYYSIHASRKMAHHYLMTMTKRPRISPRKDKLFKERVNRTYPWRFFTQAAIKGIGNLISPMFSFITRKMVMKHIIYGMHIHVRFMDWPITMYPSVGRDELFIWKFCWLERRLTMKNIILVSKRRNTRRTRRDKNSALVVKWVDIE